MREKYRRLITITVSVALFLMIILVISIIRGKMLVLRTYHISGNSENELKIVGLADYHGGILGAEREEIICKVEAENPDLIVLVGDMIDQAKPKESAEALEMLLKRLVTIAPVYCVDGNHELDLGRKEPKVYEQYIKEIESAGAVHLDNEIATITLDSSGNHVNLCGITTHYYWGEEEYSLMSELKKMKGLNLLICHYPESVIWYEAFEGGGLDAALCGHTHGGLIRVPLVGGYYAPEQSRWPKYDLGEYPVYTDTTWSDYGGKEGAEYLGTMIISGGLAGEHRVPRVNNPMEISLLLVSDEL